MTNNLLSHRPPAPCTLTLRYQIKEGGGGGKSHHQNLKKLKGRPALCAFEEQRASRCRKRSSEGMCRPPRSAVKVCEQLLVQLWAPLGAVLPLLREMLFTQTSWALTPLQVSQLLFWGRQERDVAPEEGCGPWRCQEKDAAPGDARRRMWSLGLSGEGCSPWRCQKRDAGPGDIRRRMWSLEMLGEGCAP